MFNILNPKNFGKVIATILNSKYTYLLLILIILVQFILTSIIFLQNKKDKYLLEQTNFQTSASLNQIKQLNERINSLQSYVMRLTAQIYRAQSEKNNQN